MTKNNVFKYDNRIIFNDNLVGFKEVILNSKKFFNIYFDFKNKIISLKKVKEIILTNKNNINFNKLYFYNANDFINIILGKPIYLPKNVNLFISETCPIGCIYCENINDIHNFLSLKKIKNFLSKYNLGDNMNFNILGQGDPIFNPELLDIILYIKSKGGYITFFSGGRSLLFIKNFDKFSNLIDEFKINLSASNYEIYNLIHKNKITKDDFVELCNRFKKISNKSTFLSILLKENISDLLSFVKFIVNIGAKGIEIKKNLQYIKGDILEQPLILDRVGLILKSLSKIKKINIISNIGTGFTKIKTLNSFYNNSITLLDSIVEEYNIKISINEINKMGKCFQFGNSIDIIETGDIAICCHYKDSIISHIDFNGLYYNNKDFIKKRYIFNKITPDACYKCPMPVDRYNSFLKDKIVNEL